MAFPGGAFALGAAGLRGIERFLQDRAERARLRELRAELFAAQRPAQAALSARSLGLTSNEAFVAGARARAVAGGFVGSGFGRSTLTGPATSAAIAPVLAQREAEIRAETARLAAARQQILLATAQPGGSPFVNAFGGFLGDVGDVLAQRSGTLLNDEQFLRRIEQLRGLIPQEAT